MHEIEAEFSVVTPLFMSGANQQQTELRITSIKGAIRFWWRALNYAQQAKRAEGSIIQSIKVQEDKVFGSTQAQAAVRFQLTTVSTKPGSATLFNKQHGLIYLGYGVVDRDGHLERPCYESAQFTLKLISKHAIQDHVTDAIKLFGLIGGIGSRSRKGFGSVNLQRMDITSGSTKQTLFAQEDKLNYQQTITQLLNKYQISTLTSQPQYSALSNNSRLKILLTSDAPKKLLNDYGMKMQRYRSWGYEYNNEHKLPGNTPAEQNFESDHHWFKQPEWRANPPNFHPERAIFGLPHNYFKSKNQTATVQPASDLERRASPLFFHVHQQRENEYLGIAILLPAAFLPTDVKLDADGTQVDVDTKQFKVILDFFSGYEGHRTNKSKTHYFPNRLQLWPKPLEENKA